MYSTMSIMCGLQYLHIPLWSTILLPIGFQECLVIHHSKVHNFWANFEFEEERQSFLTMYSQTMRHNIRIWMVKMFYSTESVNSNHFIVSVKLALNITWYIILTKFWESWDPWKLHLEYSWYGYNSGSCRIIVIIILSLYIVLIKTILE